MSERGRQALQILKEPRVLDEQTRRDLVALLEATAPPRMTFEEFLEWMDEDTWAEWVDGEVVMNSPTSRRHQEVGGFLYRLLDAMVRWGQEGVVLNAPFLMRLTRSAREPDLIFIASEHLDRLHDTYLDGPSDLAVEIVSPESVDRDRGTKFREYEEAGLPEYWIIDPEREAAEFYQLDEDGRYHPAPPDAEGIYRSRKIPGFWMRVEWLWQDPLPQVEDVLLEVGGEAYAHHLIERLRARGLVD